MAKSNKRKASLSRKRLSTFKELAERYKGPIIQGHIEGKTKQEMANKLKLSIADIMSISRLYTVEINAAIKKHQEKQSQPKPQPKSKMPEVEAKPTPEVKQEPEIKEPVVLISDDIKFVDVHSTVKNRKISNEQAAQILSDIREDVLSQRDLATMYGVSASTISAIKNGKGRFKLVNVQQKIEVEPPRMEDLDPVPMPRPNKRQRKQQKIQNQARQNIVDLNDEELLAIPVAMKTGDAQKAIKDSKLLEKPIPVTKYLKCGMIANRHDMPVDVYVFQSLTTELMNDYTMQYDVARHNLELLTTDYNNNRVYNGVYLYVTGFASALASIIRACMDLKLNLILMHHRPSDGQYYHQLLFNDLQKDNPCPPELEGIKCRRLMTCGCLAQDFVKIRTGYVIVEFIPANKQLDFVKDVILFTNKNKALEYYMTLLESTNNNVLLNAITIDRNNHLCIGETLQRRINSSYR